ncbi:MAG: hypothetical protein S4CHLAM123_00870 [Chlamydiales bacterium]|nr:hypothetical protein [Chlamydiales bacterium]
MKANGMEQQLYQIASLQQGYFTARQAKEVGHADSRFPYHVRKGRWIREDWLTTQREIGLIWSIGVCGPAIVRARCRGSFRIKPLWLFTT